MKAGVLNCPKCQSSEKVDFERLSFRFVRYRKTDRFVADYCCLSMAVAELGSRRRLNT